MTQIAPIKTIDEIVEDGKEAAAWDAKYRVRTLADNIAMHPRKLALVPFVQAWLENCQLEKHHISHVAFSSKHEAPKIIVILGTHGRLEHVSDLISSLEETYGESDKTIDFHSSGSREYLFGTVVTNEGQWNQKITCNLTVDVQFGHSQFCRVVKQEVGQEIVTKYEQHIECDPAPGTVIEGV